MANELEKTLYSVDGQLKQLTPLVVRALDELKDLRERVVKLEEARRIVGEYARDEKHDVKARLEKGDGTFGDLCKRVQVLEQLQALRSGIWGKLAVAGLSIVTALVTAYLTGRWSHG